MLINEITGVFNECLSENRLPPLTIMYENNTDKSISVNFAKKLMLKIVDDKNRYLQVPISFLNTVKLDDNIEVKNLKSLVGYSRIIINTISLTVTEIHLLKLLFSWHIDNFSAEPFACCSSYVECSDKMQCVHYDLLYAKGCSYRKNLESGRIFYGVNKNI